MIPAAGVHLDEPHSGFRQPPGQKALTTERVSWSFTDSVQLLICVGLAIQFEQFGSFRLHAEGEFVIGDARGDFGVVGLFEALLVEVGEGGLREEGELGFAVPLFHLGGVEDAF